MTIRAYSKTYLEGVQKRLGNMFDYAVNACNLSGDYFTDLFVVSSISKRIERGDPAIIAGKSGIELAVDVVCETTGTVLESEQSMNFARSKEYWVGWTIAYYQWYSDRKYGEIFKVFTFEDLVKMYNPLHEADITKFVEIADERIKEYFKDTNLKRLRKIYGSTQAELSEKSGVSLRSIQMYEQRQKDINKASAESLYKLAKVLGCTIEELMQK